MAIQRTRRKIVTLETEVTYGTDPVPTNADTIRTRALTRTPYDGPSVERTIDRSTLGGYEQINTSPRVEIGIEAYLAASGNAADALPNWDKMALSCGMAATVTASTQVEYGLVSADADFDSCSIYFYKDGDLQKVTGCRGNLEVNFASNELPFMVATMMGLYADPTSVAIVSDGALNVGGALPVTNANTTTVTIHSQAVKLKDLSVNLNNVQSVQNIPNLNEVFITNRAVSGSMTILAEDLATKNWFTAQRSDNGVTKGPLSVVHGTVATQIVHLDGPSVQLSNLSEGDDEGLATYSFDMSFLPVSGDDEWTITTL